MDIPKTPRHATEDELAEQLRGLLAFVDRENRQSLEWMIEKPRKRLNLPRVLSWLDGRFVSTFSYDQLDANKFCDLVDDRFGIVVPFALSKTEEFWWREPNVAYDQVTWWWKPTNTGQANDANLVFLVEPGRLACFFSWKDNWIDHSYLHLCRRS